MNKLLPFYNNIREKNGIAVITTNSDEFSVDAAVTRKNNVKEFKAAVIKAVEQCLNYETVKITTCVVSDYGYKAIIGISYVIDGEKFNGELTLTFNTLF